MNIDKSLALQLEEIITAGLEDVPIPYQKGNSIRIKHIAIRKHKNGYKLFDCATNSHVVTTFSKTGAIAIAKILAEGGAQSDVQMISTLDDKVAKHYMDAVFAKRAYETSKDEVRRDNAEVLLDIAMDKAYQSLEVIESYIFDK